MYVCRGLERTCPSRMIPMPILFALPSNPIAVITIDLQENEFFVLLLFFFVKFFLNSMNGEKRAREIKRTPEMSLPIGFEENLRPIYDGTDGW